MDLANIFSVTTLLVLLSISGVRSATVSLSKSADKGQLGNNSLSLYCDYSLSANEIVFSITLKRKRADDSSFYPVVTYYEDNNFDARHLANGLDLKGRTVLTNPTSSNRRAVLQFSSIHCEDEADYRCELFYAAAGQGDLNVNSSTRIVVTAAPIFGNQSLIYTPSTDLAENQNVTLTCVGNIGREPQGTFLWYRYVGGQAPGMAITNGINPVSLTNVVGSCTYVRIENLILTLTKEDNQMVIRCTVRQTTMTEAGDGNIQTDRISVYYVPRINLIESEPDLPIYSEGLALLMLICNADSNPPSNYIWTLPDKTAQTGYQLCITSLTTIHAGRYTCMAYTGWGGHNYTSEWSIDITVVATTPHSPNTTTTTTTTRSSTTVPMTKKPGAAAYRGNNVAQAVKRILPPSTTITTTTTTRSSCTVSITKKPGTAATSWTNAAQTVKTTSPSLISTATSTRSLASVSLTTISGTLTNIESTAHTVNMEKENVSSTLFTILFGVVLGVSVFLVTILSICLHKQRMLAADLKHQLQTRSNTYDGLNMRLTTTEPYAALTVERSDDYHQSSAYLNPYEGLHRTEPYDSLDRRL